MQERQTHGVHYSCIQVFWGSMQRTEFRKRLTAPPKSAATADEPAEERPLQMVPADEAAWLGVTSSCAARGCTQGE